MKHKRYRTPNNREDNTIDLSTHDTTLTSIFIQIIEPQNNTDILKIVLKHETECRR